MKRLAYFLLALALQAGLGQAARFQFDEIGKLVQVPVESEKVEVVYGFTITGDGEARVAEIVPTCSCMEADFTAKGKKLWKSGETGELRVVFNVSNMQGEVKKATQIRLAGEEKPSITLYATLNIPELLKIAPTTYKWEQNGSKEEKIYEIDVVGEEGAKITQVSSTNALFQYELETVVEGKKYRLKAWPTSTLNPAMVMFRIWTDSKHPKHKKYHVFGAVSKPRSAAGKSKHPNPAQKQ